MWASRARDNRQKMFIFPFGCGESMTHGVVLTSLLGSSNWPCLRSIISPSLQLGKKERLRTVAARFFILGRHMTITMMTGVGNTDSNWEPSSRMNKWAPQSRCGNYNKVRRALLLWFTESFQPPDRRTVNHSNWLLKVWGLRQQQATSSALRWLKSTGTKLHCSSRPLWEHNRCQSFKACPNPVWAVRLFISHYIFHKTLAAAAAAEG